MSYTKGYRYSQVPGSDNTYAIPHKQILNPSYSANIALSPDAEETLVDFEQLTGATTITSDVDLPFAMDKMKMVFAADGTNRVVTFGTGFTSAGTITCLASKNATAEFIFSSHSQTWVEVSRYVQS